MYRKFLKPISILGIALLSNYSFANTDPLIGKWRTIDERTGYSLSDIQISKMKDGSYKATIQLLKYVLLQVPLLLVHALNARGSLKTNRLSDF